ESHATTSPSSRSASHTPKADFPEAVGPTMATSGKGGSCAFIGTGDATRGRAKSRAQRQPGANYRVSAGVRVSLARIDGKIVKVSEAQRDIGSVEFGRQRLERSGRADG